ncbi:MAG: Trans-aconitate 2-methyltransferase [Chlamydiia bacterium]|nr:Trans-aconitate 2-methyltransferase [Chlamydiia bacterium]MCH9618975.1 Trans-aconitate 2-methyltransferase [Chlamydiia bacterium]MCH9623817.1 Trans-aconitate 2-methyltransferase [Chlamydiia bacterium]
MEDLLELDAEHYKKYSNTQYSQAKKLLQLVDVQNTDSILDVGCGHGHITAEMALLVPKGNAIGIDASKEMIKLAKEKFDGIMYENLNYLHVKAEDMIFPRESLDLIICTNAMMWVREQKKVLDSMADFLKSRGSIVIFTYPTTTPYALLFEEVLEELFPELRHKSALKTMLSPAKYKEILENNGLNIKLFEIEDVIFSYKDMDEFKNYVKGWLVCYAPLSEIQQECFLYELCKKISQKGYNPANQKITIPHQTLKIIAKKP